ncbi:hypothetical protein EJ04DRAFT_581557 [Polyplosphaeria fusca]|uniref:Uncharacterized protein n=1 Tax=Polyplosphaeria fusca TaxID=682080 RepID=A0A9P4QNQ4_9PLEO|nr:hypothetical protein EJ04DRAFT_581557 [Polyplosphaeria fusca]
MSRKPLNKDRTKSNVLKYTCKKLYMDTRGLGLKYNPVIFTDSDFQPSWKNSIQLSDSLAPSRQRVFRAIVRDDYDMLCRGYVRSVDGRTETPGVIGYTMKSISKMMRFCQLHPNIHVVWRTHALYDYRTLILLGLAYLRAFRNTQDHNSLMAGRGFRDSVEMLAMDLSWNRRTDCQDAPNLRILPCDPMLNRKWFRDSFRRIKKEFGEDVPDEVVHDMTELAVSWWTNGI